MHPRVGTASAAVALLAAATTVALGAGQHRSPEHDAALRTIHTELAHATA
eukprot:SAG11_NODE_27371_length_333_cov_1.102564_1_plen_49_part_10